MHLLAGTFRAPRPPMAEAPLGRPQAPAGLTGEARAEWDRMADRLEQLGILSRVDDAVLIAWCELHAAAVRLQAAADALGSPVFERVTVDGAGVEHREPKVHPVFTQLRQVLMAKRQFLVELGLTPASRNRVARPASGASGLDPKKAKYLHGLP